jgi:uncharacterized protein (DUF302 family)
MFVVSNNEQVSGDQYYTFYVGCQLCNTIAFTLLKIHISIIQELSMYGFTVNVSDSFDDAVARVTEELQKEGFGVLTEIDVKATLKKKLDIDKRPYKILGACNPVLANQALDAEPDIGLLLPCNVIVREEEDGSVTVGFMDPAAVLGLVQREELKNLGGEVRQRLERVRDALAG